MSEEITAIMQDKRPVIALYSEGGETIAAVGNAITKIVPYQEGGEMGYVTWFAIYTGESIWMRVPARFCQVQYGSTAPAGEKAPF